MAVALLAREMTKSRSSLHHLRSLCCRKVSAARSRSVITCAGLFVAPIAVPPGLAACCGTDTNIR